MNTAASPTALSQLFRRPEGGVLPLLQKAGQLQALNDTLITEADSTFAAHCRIVNLRGSVLVLAASSAAWATRLRFQTGELLTLFRQRGWPGLASVELVIRPADKDLAPGQDRASPPVDHRPPPAVRERIAQGLRADAGGLPPEIGQRMLKLANSYTKSI